MVSTNNSDCLMGRTSKNDFEGRMTVLLQSLASTQTLWTDAAQPETYHEAMSHLGQFAVYKKTSKREYVRERQELAALYSNIQTKLRTYSLRAWEPSEGLRLDVSDNAGRTDDQNLEQHWAVFLVAEGGRSRAINANIRE